MCRSNQIRRIEDQIPTASKILGEDRIHVMHQHSRLNLVARHAQIAAIVAEDHEVANLLPLPGLVKPLVDPSVKPEGGDADLAA
jgi:hypothetical protein